MPVKIIGCLEDEAIRKEPVLLLAIPGGNVIDCGASDQDGISWVTDLFGLSDCREITVTIYLSCPKDSVGHPYLLKPGFPPKHCGNDIFFVYSQTKLTVRAKASKLQDLFIRFAVNQYEIRFDVAIAVVFPGA